MDPERKSLLKRLDGIPRSWATACVMLMAILPYLFHHDWEFSSDDWLLISSVQSDGGVVPSLWTHLTQAYYGTWLFNIYMPLYSWTISLEARIFGANPTGYFVINALCFSVTAGLGFLAASRLVGRRAAFIGALLFAINPWTVNNVCWMVGRCSTVSAAFIFLGLLLYFAWRDRGEVRQPIALIALILVAVFYRQTAAFLPVFIVLIELFEGRFSLRRMRLWALLGAPVVLYMVACYLVLGAWTPNYALVQAISGNVGDQSPSLFLRMGTTLRDLLLPAGSDESALFDFQRWVALGLLLGVFVLGIRCLVMGKSRLWLLLCMAVAHAAPMFWVSWVIHGENVQRWIVVSWLIALITAEFLRRSFVPLLSVFCVVGLIVVSALRLHENLEGYERAARMSRTIRTAIAASDNDLVFVNNVQSTLGPAPFYSFGLGATQQPPFGPGRKAAYPIMQRALFATDVYSQVPIGCVLPEYGVKCTTLFVDYDNEQVVPVNPASQIGARSIFDQIPRLELISPQDEATASDSLALRLETAGAEQIDVHVLTPTKHIHFSRVRGRSYEFGRFHSDGTFTEDLWPELQMASFLSGPAQGRCYLWVVLYKKSDLHIPMSASRFIALNSTASQAKRSW